MSRVRSRRRFLGQVTWKRMGTRGRELCTLTQGDDGIELNAIVYQDDDEEQSLATYLIRCDAQWQTQRVSVKYTPAQGRKRRIKLAAHNGIWSVNDQDAQVLAGCVDVDLGVTPSTNTLPIRRLNLAVGESAEVTAAWVRFPELTVEPLAQRYTRLDERRYRYESASGFVAELEVDELGLVVRYGDIWERVGE